MEYHSSILKMDSTFLYHSSPQHTQQISFSFLTFTAIQTEHIIEQIRQYEKNDIHVISIFDKNYPSLLKEIYQPPWALFVKGNLSLLETQSKLAVVGSRQATQYGKKAIRVIFPELLENGVVIVSGLAAGYRYTCT